MVDLWEILGNESKMLPVCITAGLSIQTYWAMLYIHDKDNLIHNDNWNKVIAGTEHFKISYWSLIHFLVFLCRLLLA
eukprot:UN33428